MSASQIEKPIPGSGVFRIACFEWFMVLSVLIPDAFVATKSKT